ncbi:MAG: zinc ribbon domain-containing protein [Staphylococcus equorum]|nr:zinc ribbon domain-containing protein [Staphylococcus equorum]
MHCPNCGESVTKKDLFCGECGTKLTLQDQSSTDNPTTNQHTSKSDASQNHEPSHTSHQPKQPSQSNKNITKHSDDIFNEAKLFFSSSFSRTDEAVISKHQFTFKTLFSLIIAGFIITLILLSLVIPAEVAFFATSKANIVFNITFYILIAISIIFAITLLLIKLLNIKISVHKALSDFVLINTFSVIAFLLGLLFLAINVPSFGSMLVLISMLFTLVSPIYLTTKHSHMHQLRMPVIYAILIYILILGVLLRILIEGTVSNSLSALDSYFNTDY